MKKFHEMFRDQIDPDEPKQAKRVTGEQKVGLAHVYQFLRVLLNRHEVAFVDYDGAVILKRAINNAPCGRSTLDEIAEIGEVERLVIRPFETAKQKGQTKGAK